MKPPKRKFTGIKRGFTGGAWKWRACFKLDGRQLVGQYREEQAEAFADYERLRESGGQEPVEIRTLGQALARVEADLLERGKEGEARRSFKSRRDFLLSFWDGESTLAKIDAREIEWMIAKAQAAGRHANTLATKDLPLLARCYVAAGLPNPLIALREAKRLPKKVKPEVEFFTADEVRDVIARIRAYPAREQDHHADLFEFMLMSGVRASELGRIKASDVNMRARTIRIDPKVDEQPRKARISDPMVPIVNRLVDRARAKGRDGFLVPDGMNYIVRLCQRWQKRIGEPRLCGRVLRHTAVTLYLQAGGTLPEAAAFAGHALMTTTNRYAHALRDREGAGAERLGKLLRRAASGDAPHPAGG